MATILGLELGALGAAPPDRWESHLQGQYAASVVIDVPCPEKPVHLHLHTE